jgi:ABC-type amino acid transport substrate-binding protein
MRLIEGRNLGTILQSTNRALLPTFTVKIVEQVATALDAAHAAGLIHRDVKPSNILITDRDFVYLIDFGLARTAGDAAMTTAGSTLGTLAYMAPERFNGGTSDPRSDVYALTCVLYECLTGVRPYPADSLEQQLAGHMVKPIPRPSAHDPKLAAFDDVIAKGMAKKPDKRYQTAGELATAAREALAAPVRLSVRSGRHSARRVKVPVRRRMTRRVLAAAGAGVVLVAVAASVAWQVNSGPDRTRAPRQVVVAEDTATSTPPTPGAVPEIAATVPTEIRESGRLVIGVNVPYAPNEFRDAYGEIVGFDVDLMKAVSRTLGLTPEFRETAFESVIPSVRSGDFTLGMSSITDTREREETVDFVTYFQAGTLWAQRTGSSVDPDKACGLRVGVAYSVIQDTAELPAKSAACVEAGEPPLQKVVFTEQDQATAALIAGDLDAVSADSPVTGFAIKTSGGALAPAGEVFDSAPYGWPVAKGSGLAESLRQALEHIMATGEYRTIATMWGVEKGMIDKPVINGAVG